MIEADVTEFYVEANRNAFSPLRIPVPDPAQPPDQWLYGPTVAGPDSVWIVRRAPVRFSGIEVVGQ